VAFALALAALRWHPFSLLFTVVLVTVSTGLLGISVPLTLLTWVVTSLLGLQLWSRFETPVLGWLGCRPPSRLECERLEPILNAAQVSIHVLDAPEPWLGIGLRNLVVSRALLDVLDDRALLGLLTQASHQVRSASLAGEPVVWLGNVPSLSAWWVGRCVARLGRLLAIVVGTSLVIPMVLCPDGFVRWVGRLFGVVIVGVLGAVLLSNRLAAPGLGLLLGWALVPGLVALLGWERRRADRSADDKTVEGGLGWQLLEALETLVWAEKLVAPRGPLGLLAGVSTPITARADRIWRTFARG
jgi:hypothetical protein